MIRLICLSFLLVSLDSVAGVKIEVYKWEFQNSVFAQCGVIGATSCIKIRVDEDGDRLCIIHANRYERSSVIRQLKDRCDEKSNNNSTRFIENE